MYATYPTEESSDFRTLLLSFTLFESETSQSSSSHEKLFQYELIGYNGDLNNVCAIIGDNFANNLPVATKSDIGFVGCASYRYQVSIKGLSNQSNR